MARERAVRLARGEPLPAQPSGLRLAAGISIGRLARRKPLGALSLGMILVLGVCAVAAEYVAPYDPYFSFRGRFLEGPSPQFWMGTDYLGRDLFSRIVHGARVSFIVGFASVGMGIAGGTVLGLISGYLEGKTDLVIQRLMDAQMSLPTIILALTIVAALGAGIWNVILAIGISQVPRANRVVRGTVLSEKQNVYVEAARCIGCGAGRILFRHLFPNTIAPLIIIATVSLSAAILAEASLSFLGVGIPQPVPSWGGMLSQESRRYMLAQPWTAVWPGVAISLAVLAWNMFGDALRDLLDPRLKGR